MRTSLPQEIEIWYIIPALRRELAKAFIKRGLSQKDVSKILGVTEAAVSNYVSQKRGSDVKFSNEDKIKIKDCADKILNDKKNYLGYLYELSVKFRKPEIICKVHKIKDRSISKNCNICFR